jgi:hypothetical protein
MRIMALAPLLLAAACASREATSCPGAPSWPVSPKSLARRVNVDEISTAFMRSPELADLSGESRDAAQKWIDGEVSKLVSKLQPGDQVWFYREEKCNQCGWFREGYVAIRGCEFVAELNTLEEM